MSAGEPGSALAQGHVNQAQAGRQVDRDGVAADGREGSVAVRAVGADAEKDNELLGPAADFEANVLGVGVLHLVEGTVDALAPSGELADGVRDLLRRVDVGVGLRLVVGGSHCLRQALPHILGGRTMVGGCGDLLGGRLLEQLPVGGDLALGVVRVVAGARLLAGLLLLRPAVGGRGLDTLLGGMQ